MNLSDYLDGVSCSDDEEEKEEVEVSSLAKNSFDANEVLQFVFPESMKYPKSTGRLYAVALCGPLRDGQLRSGIGGTHVMTRWELDAMCEQFEREDLLRVYVDRVGLLTKKEQDSVVGQAGRVPPQLKREEVVELLDGKKDFHEIQAAVLNFREERIRHLKLAYPPSSKKNVRRGHKKQTQKRRSISDDVAPPEMFSMKKGLTPNGIAAHTNKLLSVHASHLCHMEDGNSSDLTANVRLIRHDKPEQHVTTDRFTCASPPVQDVVPFRQLITTLRHN